jgi:hypothetical protein
VTDISAVLESRITLADHQSAAGAAVASGMPAHNPNEVFLTAALTAVRIAREGGSATIKLPNTVTGQMESLYLDHSEACAFVAAMMAAAATALADPKTPPDALQVLGIWLTPPPLTKH